MGVPLDYHLGSLSIARNPSHPNHLLPPLKPADKRILDVGCGMGQILIALDLPPDVEAYGIDPDAAAIDAARPHVPNNVHLLVGTGEALPFEDASFDLVFSFVAVPYMDIGRAFAEMARVLRPGGSIWLALHPAAMYWRRAQQSVVAGRWKDVLYCLFIFFNGLLFHSVGAQIAIGWRRETFQTLGGMRRALRKHGIACRLLKKHEVFLVLDGIKEVQPRPQT